MKIFQIIHFDTITTTLKLFIHTPINLFVFDFCMLIKIRNQITRFQLGEHNTIN